MRHLDFPQTWCLGGAARRNITPPVGMYHRMWGAAKQDRSTGVHRPLWATALALAPDTQNADDPRARAQVIVAVDHCLLWSGEMDALRTAVSGRAGLHPEQLQIAMSHTHAAGLVDPARAGMPGGDMIATYLHLMIERIADAVCEALAAMTPVRIGYGWGHCNLAKHRDYWDEVSGQFVCGYNPSGPADPTVLVALVADEQSHPVATVVNYACHPTTLAWDNTLISPDYIGAMREVVEAACGAPCVFLQGASGDLGPRHGFVGSTSVADNNGRILGHAAASALEAIPAAGSRFEYQGPVVSGATIGVWEYRPLGEEQLCEKYRWETAAPQLALPYRPDLPRREATESQLAEFETAERKALGANDALAARDARAQAERMRRQLTRLAMLPPGDQVGVTAATWRLGDAFWVFVAGEYYQELQHGLRRRFPHRPIIVATVTNGWLPGYVPTAETYGRGIYQETIAVVAPGSLEQLIEALGDELARFD